MGRGENYFYLFANKMSLIAVIIVIKSAIYLFLYAVIKNRLLLKMKKSLIIAAMGLGLLASCSYFRDSQEEPIAEVYGNKLYLSQIRDIFPQGIKPADSLVLLKSYIESWSRKQILVHIAEDNLSAGDKDLTHELEDYRTTLLINRYEQQYLSQNLDTNITKEELQRVYNENSQSFVLSASIVRALYIKVKSNSPYVGRFREMYKQSGETVMRQLETLGKQAAENFDYFNDKWVFFNEILSELPTKPDNADEFLVKNPNFEQHDSTYTYFVSVRVYKLKGTQSPFDFERETIKNIILNKRRQDLIQRFEKNVFDDAKRDEKVKVYVDNK